jgi:hypothetical protein
MPVQTRSLVKAAMKFLAEKFLAEKPLAEKLAAEKLAAEKKVERVTATLVTEKELEALGLNPHSQNSKGYRIVLAGPLVEFKYLRTKNVRAFLYGKWAIAPEGYYWASSSDTAYYNFDEYYLSELPISMETFLERQREKEERAKEEERARAKEEV